MVKLFDWIVVFRKLLTSSASSASAWRSHSTSAAASWGTHTSTWRTRRVRSTRSVAIASWTWRAVRICVVIAALSNGSCSSICRIVRVRAAISSIKRIARTVISIWISSVERIVRAIVSIWISSKISAASSVEVGYILIITVVVGSVYIVTVGVISRASSASIVGIIVVSVTWISPVSTGITPPATCRITPSRT